MATSATANQITNEKENQSLRSFLVQTGTLRSILMFAITTTKNEDIFKLNIYTLEYKHLIAGDKNNMKHPE